MSGQQTARSHLETACAETPRRAAKASCVIPMRRRKTASLSPNSVVNCILRLLILDIPQLPSGGYSGCHLPPRNCAASNLNIAVCYRGGDAHLCFISDTEFYRATSGREFPRKPQIIAHPMPFFFSIVQNDRLLFAKFPTRPVLPDVMIIALFLSRVNKPQVVFWRFLISLLRIYESLGSAFWRLALPYLPRSISSWESRMPPNTKMHPKRPMAENVS